MYLYLIIIFIKAVVTEEGSIFYIYFYAFYFILPESTYLLGFYCTSSIVHKIMLLALILILNFSSLLSKENAVGMRFQSQTEYKIRNAF